MMQKTFFTLLSFLVINSLISIQIINNGSLINLEISEMEKYEQIKIQTTRDKDGKIKDDEWIGISIQEILKKTSIDDFDNLKFSSADNYMARLSKEQIEKEFPIIALQRNGKKLNADNIRLIVPNMRDMFWIQGIAKIETEKENQFDCPKYIYTAEIILKEKPLKKNPTPFTRCVGYHFRDLLIKNVPNLSGEILLIAEDGVSHKFDYEQFLSEAVLIKDGEKYHLKSSQMPAGMWIKNLAFVQIENRGFVFGNCIEDWNSLKEIMKWKIPQLLILNKVTILTDYNHRFLK